MITPAVPGMCVCAVFRATKRHAKLPPAGAVTVGVGTAPRVNNYNPAFYEVYELLSSCQQQSSELPVQLCHWQAKT